MNEYQTNIPSEKILSIFFLFTFPFNPFIWNLSFFCSQMVKHSPESVKDRYWHWNASNDNKLAFINVLLIMVLVNQSMLTCDSMFYVSTSWFFCSYIRQICSSNFICLFFVIKCLFMQKKNLIMITVSFSKTNAIALRLTR